MLYFLHLFFSNRYTLNFINFVNKFLGTKCSDTPKVYTTYVLFYLQDNFSFHLFFLVLSQGLCFLFEYLYIIHSFYIY